MAKQEKQQALDAIVAAIKQFQMFVDAYESTNLADLLKGDKHLNDDDVKAYAHYKQTLKGLWNARERIEKH